MDLFQTVVLSLIQGLSEFLPISSSAHLILVPKLSAWPDQGLGFDVVVHLGTLSAVVYYYRSIIRHLAVDLYYSITQTQTVGQSKLSWAILVGTIPVGLVGLLFKDYIEINLRSIEVIAYSTLIFGLLLGLAGWFSANNDKPREIIGWLDVAFVGFMQAIALVPGVSRSGITITAGLLIGLSRNMAIQFAFLLSIPVIILSAMLIIVDMYKQSQAVDWSVLVVGFFVAAISSYFTIVFFIKLLDRVGLMPFVVYRVVLGVLLLAL